MFNFGAFAGGLAEGARSGQNMALRQKQAERAAQADEREAEIHQAKMDKAVFHKDTRDRLRAANDEIAAGWGQSIRQQSTPSITFKPDQADSGSDAPVETGPIFGIRWFIFTRGASIKSTCTLADSRLAGSMANTGLMSQYKNLATQKNPDKTSVTETADEMIGRRMLTGDLLDDPDELTRMASIYKKHGLLKEMTPWITEL